MHRTLLAVVVITAALALVSVAAQDPLVKPEAVGPDAPFRNPDLSDDRRLADLVSRLTIDEKIVLLGTIRSTRSASA